MVSFERFHDEVVMQNRDTPDLPELNFHEEQYVFVYGTLKKESFRGNLIAGEVVSAQARTIQPIFRIKTYAAGGYPLLYADPKHDERGYITGQLLLVPTREIPVLDNIEQNGYLYTRHLHTIWCTDLIGSKRCSIQAWVYLANLKNFPSDQTNYNQKGVETTRINGYNCFAWN